MKCRSVYQGTEFLCVFPKKMKPEVSIELGHNVISTRGRTPSCFICSVLFTYVPPCKMLTFRCCCALFFAISSIAINCTLPPGGLRSLPLPPIPAEKLPWCLIRSECNSTVLYHNYPGHIYIKVMDGSRNDFNAIKGLYQADMASQLVVSYTVHNGSLHQAVLHDSLHHGFCSLVFLFCPQLQGTVPNSGATDPPAINLNRKLMLFFFRVFPLLNFQSFS